MSPIRVLLVEDNETEAAQARSMICDSDEAAFDVTWVATGEAALAALASAGADVALVDASLNTESGFDLLRRIRERPSPPPLVLLAEYRDAGRDAEALRLGADDFLVKGETTAPALQRALRNAVERSRTAAELRDSQARLVQAERIDSLGRLAGGIAHDFSNLLTGILSCTAVLERQIDPDHPSRESVDAIRRSAELASRLTRQLLAYSRKQTLEQVPLNLALLVEGIAEILRRLIGDHLTFTVENGRGLPFVTGDRAQIEQVVMNLVLNARDATPPGGTIALRTSLVRIGEAEAAREQIGPPGDYVRLSVEDTGRGMPPDVLSRIFEPFFTTKPTGSGTGLGLATSFGIIKQCGGFMRATSRVGEGTLIAAYLPRTEHAAAATEPGAPGASAAEAVLVVEDDPGVRRYIGEALSRFGYRPVVVESPYTAIELVSSAPTPFALLIADVVLPEMSGMHLAQRLGRLQAGLRVVFMSGYIDPRTGHAALPADALFLRKPFPPDELARVVRRALEAPGQSAAARRR
jgi:signal transduction histidine kinase